jgi:hypothetical protein
MKIADLDGARHYFQIIQREAIHGKCTSNAIERSLFDSIYAMAGYGLSALRDTEISNEPGDGK